MKFSASIHQPDIDGKAAEVVVTGSTTGKGEPVYEFDDEYSAQYQKNVRELLATAYDEGLYGTGSTGQVRDMVHAMEAVSEPSGLVLVIPKETQKQIDEEIKADEQGLPDGAVF